MNETKVNGDNPVDVMDIRGSIKSIFMNAMIADINIILLKQVLFIVEINQKIQNKIIQ